MYFNLMVALCYYVLIKIYILFTFCCCFLTLCLENLQIISHFCLDQNTILFLVNCLENVCKVCVDIQGIHLVCFPNVMVC